jgi:hypothetical protein
MTGLLLAISLNQAAFPLASLFCGKMKQSQLHQVRVLSGYCSTSTGYYLQYFYSSTSTDSNDYRNCCLFSRLQPLKKQIQKQLMRRY